MERKFQNYKNSLIEHFFGLDRVCFQFLLPQAKGGKYSNNSSRNSLKPYSENYYCQNSLGGHHRVENRTKNAFKFNKKEKIWLVSGPPPCQRIPISRSSSTEYFEEVLDLQEVKGERQSWHLGWNKYSKTGLEAVPCWSLHSVKRIQPQLLICSWTHPQVFNKSYWISVLQDHTEGLDKAKDPPHAQQAAQDKLQKRQYLQEKLSQLLLL